MTGGQQESRIFYRGIKHVGLQRMLTDKSPYIL